MKKIINGFRYDTEKAISIGSYDYGYYPQSGDFSHWNATLYKTPRIGKFFLVGEGGAMTEFAENLPDGGRCGGEKLIVLNSQSAMEWAERYLDAEVIEQHFAEQIKNA